MSSKVYLVTGAARGIGLALVKSLSIRPDTIVFAGIRDLSLGDEHPLSELIKDLPEVVFPVKITSADEVYNKAAAEYIKERVGKVDVIIANAGVNLVNLPALDTPPVDLFESFRINAIGPLVLYQAFSPLLLASDSHPRFAVITSMLGSMGDLFPFPGTSYGTSKAAANYITAKINQEVPDLIAFPIHPGFVDTDMSRAGLVHIGKEPKALGAISTEESAKGILDLVDKATKESHGGKFWNHDGTQRMF